MFLSLAALTASLPLFGGGRPCARQLRRLAGAPSPFTLTVDGRAEGRYRVTGSIKRMGRVVLGTRSWSDYSIRLGTLFWSGRTTGTGAPATTSRSCWL